MRTRSTPEGERLLKLMAEGRALIAGAEEMSRETDQLIAARKEARKRGRTRERSGRGQALAAGPGNFRADVGDACPGSRDWHVAPRQSPPVLIVVENNADDFARLKRALWKTGSTLRVWWAHNGEEAQLILDTVKSSAPSICVVADVQLPGGDGFELLEKIKGRPSPVRVKFAFLTRHIHQKTKDRAYAAGGDGFFVKPNDPAEFIPIARALHRITIALDDVSTRPPNVSS
ncbi:MAG: response regulator [Verrucomicrobiota bacterium]